MSRIIMEACCGSADDVIEAVRGGADRVELNSSLFLGGLTPSVGTLTVARRTVSVPIMTMLRPRSGGFCYTEAEFASMLEDGRELLAHGADGLVFGCLDPDGRVNEKRTRALTQLCGDKTSVFHRAIDVTPDWKQALDTLIRLGVRRVLTSGQAPSALYGAEVIAEMIRFVGDAIEILPGAGVNLRSADQLIARTGCTQVHLSHHRRVDDPSTSHNTEIFFGGALYPPETYYSVSDSAYFSQMRTLLDHSGTQEE